MTAPSPRTHIRSISSPSRGTHIHSERVSAQRPDNCPKQASRLKRRDSGVVVAVNPRVATKDLYRPCRTLWVKHTKQRNSLSSAIFRELIFFTWLKGTRVSTLARTIPASSKQTRCVGASGWMWSVLKNLSSQLCLPVDVALDAVVKGNRD